jgi:CMP/dCMP kinase
MKKIIVAIDGPAGSGKTTSARIVAEKLNYIYVDTGAMYRAVTLAWLRNNLPLDEEPVCKMLEGLTVVLEQSPSGQRTLLNAEDVSEEIRHPDVTKFVSPISAISCVRVKMTVLQREMGKNGGVVMDGRDIGAFVFPFADLKIFLTASIEARAKRRMLELEQKGLLFDIEEIRKQISDRDTYDSTREISPLKKAVDAIEIDTSEISIEQQTDIIYKMAIEAINKSI